MKIQHGIAGAVISLAGITTAQASDSSFYLGLGLGQSSFDSGVSSLTGTASLDESDKGFKLFAGYKINKYFSLEGHYADFGETSLTGNNGDTFVLDGTTYAFTANNVSVKSEPTSFGLSAILRYPVTQSIEPFAKLGLHSWDVDGTLTSTAGNASTSDSGTDALFGIGVNISITDSLSARLEAERFKFDNDDLDFISIGIQYNF